MTAADGELYLWGKLLNPKGKEENDGDQVTPRLVRTSDAVTRLQCSHFHTAFITGGSRHVRASASVTSTDVSTAWQYL